MRSKLGRPQGLGITHEGSLAPVPDYQLHHSLQFVETEADFWRLNATTRRIGDDKTFENFVVQLSQGVDVVA